ncbi:unnamed protein product [Linum tenue]|uniref:Uncharacterized protein n=1 Tax=Linum tenue TaxID=586396 RepID=A0AAV0H1Z5_9ROSI|nr:unnamed protein product [Linum tenue]
MSGGSSSGNPPKYTASKLPRIEMADLRPEKRGRCAMRRTRREWGMGGDWEMHRSFDDVDVY